MSGPDAFAVAERLTGRRPEAGRAAFVRIADPSRPSPTALDEGILLAFRAPRSYTGEDVVELQCHGGAVTPRRVLAACFAAGARLARRGEFTERAFLNGRLDYDQAAAVLDLVDAKTDRAADAALAGLSGRRADELRRLYADALDVSTRLEHALDVSEDELPPGFEDELRGRIEDVRRRIARALRTANEGRLLRDGARVVLAGPPNAGKSSLLNALLARDRAIVSDAPGTTRDAIEEWIDIDGWPVRLVDTAGLRDAADAVEAEGVRRSERLIADAEVVVALSPADAPCDETRRPVSADGRARPQPTVLAVTSKCDLGRGEGLNVSAKTGEGLDALRRAIVAALESRLETADADAADGGLSAAATSALSAARAAIDARIPPPSAGLPLDLVLAGNAMRMAAEQVGSLVGAVYSEDLLDNLFSRFCVGK